MSSGERKKKDDTDDTSKNEVSPISHNPSKYNDNPVMEEKSKWKMPPQLITSAVTPKTKNKLTTEKPTSAIVYEPNDYYPRVDYSSLPSTLTSNLPLEASLSDPKFAPSDCPTRDPYIFLVSDPTAMFQKYLQKDQMELPVVATRLSYSPEVSIPQLKSLLMMIKNDDSAYPTDIPDLNE